MKNIVLPIALWTTIALVGGSVLFMAVSGLRSVWYGKVEPLTVGIIAIPGVLVLALRGLMSTWAQAAMYTLVAMFVLLLLGMVATGLRQVAREAFS